MNNSSNEEDLNISPVRRPMTTYIDETLFIKIGHISKATGIPKSKLFDKAARLLIEHYQEHNGILIDKG